MRSILSISLVLVCVGLGELGISAAEAQSASDQTVVTRSQVEPEANRVELNSADRAALETLPGVGPRTAELIIEYREQHGPFEKVEDLMNVRGIGERTFLRLRELVRVGVEPSR